MSRHSTNFEAATEVPVEAVEGLPAPVHDNVVTAAAPKARDIKGQLRRLLLAGAAVAALSGAVWYGWDYWTVGRFLVSTDDAYVKADNTTIAPKVSGYLTQVLVGDNEQREGRPGAGANRRPRLQGGARPGQGRRRRRAGDHCQQARAARRPAGGDRRRRRRLSRSTPQPRPSRARRTSVTPTSRRPDMAAYRTRRPRNPATPARKPRSSATSPISLLRRSRSSSSRPNSRRPSPPRRAPPPSSARPNSISATPRSPRRSTAWSATARSAPASSCKRARN